MNIVRWVRVQWDRVLAVAAALGGVIGLVISWAGISDEVFAARQLPYLLSGGIGGLFLLGVGATMWLSADLRDEWHKLDRIERRLEAGGSAGTPSATSAERAEAVASQPAPPAAVPLTAARS